MQEEPNYNSIHVAQVTVRNTPVYLIGDLHGETFGLIQKVKEMNIENSVFIFLGDLCLEHPETAIKWFSELDACLAARDIKSFIIRGNHDNPFLWDHNNPLYNKFWSNFKSFTPIGSHTELNINGNIGAIIPGAISLNRIQLTEGVNYWSDYDFPEAPYDMENFGENRTHVDFIIGHSGPIYDGIFNDANEYKVWADRFKEIDKQLEEDLDKEQKYFKEILKRYRPRRWYCGHYHFSKSEKYVWDNWADGAIINLRAINKQEIVRIA